MVQSSVKEESIFCLNLQTSRYASGGIERLQPRDTVVRLVPVRQFLATVYNDSRSPSITMTLSTPCRGTVYANVDYLSTNVENDKAQAMMTMLVLLLLMRAAVVIAVMCPDLRRARPQKHASS